jgi:hypothetical protein
MNNRARYFIASFIIALILVGALCGLVLVDISTELYMPGLFEPMVGAESVEDEVVISFFGYELAFPAALPHAAARELHYYRGFLPPADLLVRYGIVDLRDIIEASLPDGK